MLYGIVGALFSYCVSLVVTSPLAAFALSAGYQIIMFVVRLCLAPLWNPRLKMVQLYLAGYLLTLTYAKTSDANKDLVIIRRSLACIQLCAD